MTREEREIFEQALDAFGIWNQLFKLIEEMSELTHEIFKLWDGRGDLNNIAEEMADVQICLDQMQMALQNGGAVQSWRLKKVERLRERLEAANG